MIAERFAGHSGVKYLRSLGCERVQFKKQVCNPGLGGLPAKSAQRGEEPTPRTGAAERSSSSRQLRMSARSQARRVCAIFGRGVVRCPFREKTKNVRLLQSHL